jgi:hypothetical protein
MTSQVEILRLIELNIKKISPGLKIQDLRC